MAKKKEEQLSYLQMPLPEGQKSSRVVKVNWSGLNLRQTMDTGALSYEKNISTKEAPYLVPSGKFEEKITVSDLLSAREKFMYGYMDYIFVFGYRNVNFKFQTYTKVYDSQFNSIEFTGAEKAYTDTLVTLPGFSVCTFNTFQGGLTVADASNIVKLLVFPQQFSITIPKTQEVLYKSGFYMADSSYHLSPWVFTEQFVDKNIVYIVVENPNCPIPLWSQLDTDKGEIKYFDSYSNCRLDKNDDHEKDKRMIYGAWRYDDVNKDWYSDGWNNETGEKKPSISNGELFSTSGNPCPVLRDVTVFQSRLFGIDDTKAFASEFNNYSGWNLDTADSSSSANAWITALSANPKADGEVIAIVTYRDRVIIFRENYMYEIRNTKNPFRVVDIFQEGCVNKEAVCVVGDKLIFASRNGIKLYTGSTPQDIGNNLNIDKISYAAAGTDGRMLYLYCQTDKAEHNLFVYDNMYGQWSVMDIDKKVVCFTNNNSGMYMLTDDNTIYKFNDENYDHDWACETDFYTGGTIDIKHIRKIQIYADVDVGSSIKVSIIYDSNADDNTVVYDYVNTGEAMKKIPIRVLPRKSACYGYKIRIEGHGYVRVYQMEITLTGGGELYNGGE